MCISNIFKKITYSVIGNGFAMLISVMMIMLLPRFMSVQDYGYWQLYLFYLSYTAFFHFGLINGINLRYIGEEYSSIDKDTFVGQLYVLILVDGLIAILAFYSVGIYFERQMITILKIVSIVGFFSIIATFASFVLQTTARIEDYSRAIIFERSIFLFGILICMVFGLSNFEYLIYVSLIAKILEVIYISYLIKDIFTASRKRIKIILQEARANISCGIYIMLANIAGMLIIGAARFAISIYWDIATFSKVSLGLSVSYFFMTFISAVSVVLFPLIKRMDEQSLNLTYKSLKVSLSFLLLFMLCLYYPLTKLLKLWLPQYVDSFYYMIILLPICVFEGKIVILTNNYLKCFRMESLLLKINMFAALFSILLALISIELHNLTFALISILFSFIARYLLAEYFLGIHMSFNFIKDNIKELLLVFAFILLFIYLPDAWAATLYFLLYIAYIFDKKNDLMLVLNQFKILRNF